MLCGMCGVDYKELYEDAMNALEIILDDTEAWAWLDDVYTQFHKSTESLIQNIQEKKSKMEEGKDD